MASQDDLRIVDKELTRASGQSNGFLALRTGTRLDGRYDIQAAIAAGGFGITYVAQHVALEKICAIKEHFPRQFAYRDGKTDTVTPTDEVTFRWAMERFIAEGRALVRCEHPNVVRVTDIFEANGTAYMVLGYEEGQSLADWLKSLGRPPSQLEIDNLLMPLLSALEYVHAQGLMHRDIAPDNIMLRADGTPCLIDFGAARQAITEHSQIMSAIVKSGFSPPEQYSQHARAQGAWSDIYALGATLYRMLTGRVPVEAIVRQLEDDLQPIAEAVSDAGAYRASFLAAIDHALVLKPSDRPQSVVAWREALFGRGGDLEDADRSGSSQIGRISSRADHPHRASDPSPVEAERSTPKSRPPISLGNRLAGQSLPVSEAIAQADRNAVGPAAPGHYVRVTKPRLLAVVVAFFALVGAAWAMLAPPGKVSAPTSHKSDLGASRSSEDALRLEQRKAEEAQRERLAAAERQRLEAEAIQRSEAEERKRLEDVARLQAEAEATRQQALREDAARLERERLDAEAQKAAFDAQRALEKRQADEAAIRDKERERAAAEGRRKAEEARKERAAAVEAENRRKEKEEVKRSEAAEARRKAAEQAKPVVEKKTTARSSSSCGCDDVCKKASFYGWINNQLCSQCRAKCQ